MKKLLVVAFMSLFAISAFAVEVDFRGDYEITGYSRLNANMTDDDKAKAGESKNWSGYYHKSRINGTLKVDPKTTVMFRMAFKDNTFGRNVGMTSALDRVWARYQILDNLALTAGRMASNNFHRGEGRFGAGFWMESGVGTGTKDVIRLDYKVNNQIGVFALTHKDDENLTSNGKDKDLYVLGANMKFNDLGVFPVATFYKDNSAAGVQEILGFMVGVDYLPKSGLNVKAVAAVSNDLGDYPAGKDGATLFGASADVSFIMSSTMKAGIVLSYGSDDKDAGKAFAYGNDFDKTKIIDDGWRDGANGVSGMFSVIAYADFVPMEKVTLSAVAGYYMSMLDENNWQDLKLGANTPGSTTTKVKVTDDTKMFEIDLKGKYQFSQKTFFETGVAYAQMTDVSNGTVKYDTDPMIQFWWMLKTYF